MSTLSVRRPLSVLAVLAMVATLLFATVGTASAAAKPINPALYSACPDNAGIPDAGFTDVLPGTFFADAVNCLAYYAVTTGSTPTIYDPAADVNRAQMAVFLARAAKAAGVALSATPPDAGFTDIGDQSAEVQLSINQLADVGVVKGKTATTYNPGDTVWRQQMALFLTRWLNLAIIGPGGAAVSAAATTGAPFTDISGTTVETSKAINQMWDLGLATGTGTGTTYDPLGNVNRGQMASFLTRTFGHANVRPAGVNIQAAPVTGFGVYASTVSVTSRTATFSPSAGTIVDIWRFDPTTTTTTPFLANGTCSLGSGTILQIESGGTPCTLESVDSTLDTNGNWPLFPEAATNGKATTFYAWTAALGTQFVNGITSDYSMVTINSNKGASNATLTVNLPKYADNCLGCDNYMLKYPGSTTWTVQLTDGTGSTAKPVAKAGVLYQFTVERQSSTTPYTINTMTIATDASGKATYTATETDPTAVPGDWTWFDVNVNPLTVGAPNAWTAPGGNSWIQANWSDDLPVATTLITTTDMKYKVQLDGATSNASATVYDQYGKTMANEPVTFLSTNTGNPDVGAVWTQASQSTNGVGVATATRTWTYTGAGPDFTDEETVRATSDNVPALWQEVDFYWVDKAPSGAYNFQANMVNDVGGDSVVGYHSGNSGIAPGDYVLFKWDGNDQFNEFGFAITQKEFETHIKGGWWFEPTTYNSTASGVSSWDL